MLKLTELLRLVFAAVSVPYNLQQRMLQKALDGNNEAVPHSITARALVDENGNYFCSRQKTITGTSHTLTESDCGAMLVFTSAGPVTVTASKALRKQFTCACAQEGAGQITFAAEAGATIQGASLSTSAQYTQKTIHVISNQDSASADVRVY